ncbi:unnamed protein product [Cyprideis torosa]|uniref:Uncharacterized protein n=1 Tax=Cyprideis torosa TaxID=163714 RepID=A0A7R8ZL81_9CRUS|nr:unnamed protein product [Cyprideis torosa]CAG0881728.1 unnamed protein product [Cyprideis torosa]
MTTVSVGATTASVTSEVSVPRLRSQSNHNDSCGATNGVRFSTTPKKGRGTRNSERVEKERHLLAKLCPGTAAAPVYDTANGSFPEGTVLEEVISRRSGKVLKGLTWKTTDGRYVRYRCLDDGFEYEPGEHKTKAEYDELSSTTAAERPSCAQEKVKQSVVDPHVYHWWDEIWLGGLKTTDPDEIWLVGLVAVVVSYSPVHLKPTEDVEQGQANVARRLTPLYGEQRKQEETTNEAETQTSRSQYNFRDLARRRKQWKGRKNISYYDVPDRPNDG